MILLWGVPGDAPLDAVRAALSGVDARVRFLDQRRAATMQMELTVAPGGVPAGRIVDAEGEIDLAHMGAAYIRPVETSRACSIEAPDDPDLLRATAIDAAMVAWADLSPAYIVNRPIAMAANNSKPYQLSLIAGYGFDVPDTLVTSDERAVRQFIRWHGEVVYKSVSGVRSIVSRLSMNGGDGLIDVANCPTQFQEYIPGSDVRVHVAGATILATDIRCTADDYRYASRVGADLAMAPMELPPEIANRCLAMVGGMGLHVAGIDLRHTPEGGWCCLEVNPSPGFTFFEGATGQPIAAAIADLLVRLDHAGASTWQAPSDQLL